MRVPDASIAAKYLVNTHMMVKVVEFHPENQTVDVVQEVYDYVNTTDGEFVVQNEFGEDVVAGLKVLDVLYGIPVRQARFGQFSIRCCPQPGDTGYLEIFTEDLQDWYENGGPSVPFGAQRFLRKNSVFVPFVPNNQNAATDYVRTDTDMVIKSNKMTIVLRDSAEENYQAVLIRLTNGVRIDMSSEGEITIACDYLNIQTEQTDIYGKLQVTGDVFIQGKVETTSTIKSGDDITSGGDVITSSGTSLDNHTHTFSYNAGPTPSQGTTDVPTV